MYFVLNYTIPQDENGGYLEVDRSVLFEGFDSWSLGTRYSVALPNPIEIVATPISDYSGLPSDLYDGNICLMSKRLVEVLVNNGVDNLDIYPAVIMNSESGETYQYFAVNIIGMISAADLDASKWASFDGDALFDTSFDRLVIRNESAKEQLIFRLAQSTSTILVHERVKKCIEKEAFPSLVFVSPEEWKT